MKSKILVVVCLLVVLCCLVSCSDNFITKSNDKLTTEYISSKKTTTSTGQNTNSESKKREILKSILTPCLSFYYEFDKNWTYEQVIDQVAKKGLLYAEKTYSSGPSIRIGKKEDALVFSRPKGEYITVSFLYPRLDPGRYDRYGDLSLGSIVVVAESGMSILEYSSGYYFEISDDAEVKPHGASDLQYHPANKPGLYVSSISEESIDILYKNGNKSIANYKEFNNKDDQIIYYLNIK